MKSIQYFTQVQQGKKIESTTSVDQSANNNGGNTEFEQSLKIDVGCNEAPSVVQTAEPASASSVSESAASSVSQSSVSSSSSSQTQKAPESASSVSQVSQSSVSSSTTQGQTAPESAASVSQSSVSSSATTSQRQMSTEDGGEYRNLPISRKGQFFKDAFFENVWRDFDSAMGDMVTRQNQRREQRQQERIRRDEARKEVIQNMLREEEEQRRRLQAERVERQRKASQDMQEQLRLFSAPMTDRFMTYRTLRNWNVGDDSQAASVSNVQGVYKVRRYLTFRVGL